MPIDWTPSSLPLVQGVVDEELERAARTPYRKVEVRFASARDAVRFGIMLHTSRHGVAALAACDLRYTIDEQLDHGDFRFVVEKPEHPCA